MPLDFEPDRESPHQLAGVWDLSFIGLRATFGNRIWGLDLKTKGFFSLGPAVLVTAAFVGPGTLMAASSAGAQFGYQLLWAVAFSVFATVVLQEMASRLGIVTGTGLSESLKQSISNSALRMCALALVLLAIFVGNSAYQTGNILGAASGMMSAYSKSDAPTDDARSPVDPALKPEPAPSASSLENLDEANSLAGQNYIVLFVAAVALCVVWIGRFDVLQWLLTALVVLMSLLFIVAAIRSGADWNQVVKGFVPHIPSGADWIVIGLVGTTVVPYNLFLHASAAAQRWSGDSEADGKVSLGEKYASAIVESRWDTILSVMIGGLITCAILITASAAFHGSTGTEGLAKVSDVARQLEPALGSWAKQLFSMGLLAAGLTSAITAPVAAAYAASGCFGWSGKLSDPRLKIAASVVVLTGAVFAIQLGGSPKETIILAQVANGLLLPIVAVALLILTNDGQLMKKFKNGRLANIFAVLVILIVSVIAVNQFRKVGAILPAVGRTYWSTSKKLTAHGRPRGDMTSNSGVVTRHRFTLCTQCAQSTAAHFPEMRSMRRR